MSGAREAILAALAHSHSDTVPRPRYATFELTVDNLVNLFAAKAASEQTDIIRIASRDHVPDMIVAALRTARAPQRLHLPANSPLRALPWASRAARLEISDRQPGPDDAALSAADYGIAETGTLAFLAAPERPPSWHFLPGREFVLLSRAQVLATLEDVLALAAAHGMPSTLNLVTGPSRTGDIEQTIEIGAHGPKALHILLCD